MILAEIGVGDLLWSIFWIFLMIMYIMILFNILGDLFRDHEESGAKKALWVIFLVIFPYLTALVYLIVRGEGMAKRTRAAQESAQKQFAEYVQSVAGGGDSGGHSPVEQIESAKKLLDAGVIDQAEFETLKQKALS